MDVAALLRCLPASCAAAQTGKLVAGTWPMQPCTISSTRLASEALSCSTGRMPQSFKTVTAACASFPCLD